MFKAPVFFVFAFVCAIASAGFGDQRFMGGDIAADGAAAGFGVIAAAFVLASAYLHVNPR